MTPRQSLCLLALCILTCRWTSALHAFGFAAPPPPTAEGTIIPTSRSSRHMEERSVRMTVTLTPAAATVELRHVLFNGGRRPVSFSYMVPVPARSTLLHTSLPLERLGPDGYLDTALSYALERSFPQLLGLEGHDVYRSSPILVQPHRPWVFTATVRIPASIVDAQRIYRIPLARRGPPGPPTRRITASIRTVGGLSDRVYALAHELIPPQPRSRWCYMAMRGTDTIPEEDLVLIMSADRRPGRLETMAFTDELGTWVRGTAYLPASDEKKKARRVPPLSALFVIDVSGSLHGSMLDGVKRGLDGCLKLLDESDYFNVVPFALIPRSLHYEFLPANDENRAMARQYVQSLEGRGGTNLGETMQHAAELLAAAPAETAKRMFLVIDGKADVGILAPERLEALFNHVMPADVRLEVVSIGCDVDARLLATMARGSGGRLQFASTPDDVGATLEALFSSTTPRFPALQVSVKSGGIPVEFGTNRSEACNGDVPLLVSVHLPPHGTSSVEMSLAATSTAGDVVSDSRTDYTARIGVPVSAIGESVRTQSVLPSLASLLEAVQRPGRISSPVSWHEARIRRILRVPSSEGEEGRLGEIARISGPEVRERLDMLRRLETAGTYLPRAYDGVVFRRVGSRIFHHLHRRTWRQEPLRGSVSRVITYGSLAWTNLVRTRPDLRGVLALGKNVTFDDGGTIIAVERAKNSSSPRGERDERP